jgi:hypothetical protein
MLHAKPFSDILMITKDVVLNSSTAERNMQYGLYSQQKRQVGKLTTVIHMHYGLRKKKVMNYLTRLQ